MASDIPLIAEKKELASLVREKAEIEAKLSSAGGADFSHLLGDCADLADIIDEIDEVLSKKDIKEHAAFETKVKFSRKVRRKAKDLGNFEQKLVQEYDSKHIQLEHGRKMVEIIKLLRSKNVDKARREAQPFYEFLEMGARLEAINDLLEKKRVQVERAKHGISAQLEDLKWLEEQAPIDSEKASRHEAREKQRETLASARLRLIRHLQGMPVPALLKKAKEDRLERFGFPQISAHESDLIAAFLQKSGLETKSAAQLLELAGQSEQRLRHLGIDLALFRQEVAGRKAFLSEIIALQPSSFMESIPPTSPALDYLSVQSEDAKSAAEHLAELEKTAEQDAREWERQKKINEKTAVLHGKTAPIGAASSNRGAELAGTSKAGLEKTLQEMERLERVLDGKEDESPQQGKGERKRVLDSLFGFLKKK